MSGPDEELDWDAVSFVLSSETRARLLLELRDAEQTPSQLAENLGKHRSHVSRGLTELGDEDMVECLTPDQTKGRIYAITDKGDRVLRKVHEMTGDDSG